MDSVKKNYTNLPFLECIEHFVGSSSLVNLPLKKLAFVFPCTLAASHSFLQRIDFHWCVT